MFSAVWSAVWSMKVLLGVIASVRRVAVLRRECRMRQEYRQTCNWALQVSAVHTLSPSNTPHRPLTSHTSHTHQGWGAYTAFTPVRIVRKI